MQYALSCSDLAVGMARLAIVGLLSLSLLVLQTSAQSGVDETIIDDSDYNSESSGLQPEPDIGGWTEPEVPHDPDWRDNICNRYRYGEIYCARIIV